MLKLLIYISWPVMSWWSWMGDGPFMCSLYLSVNVLPDSPMYSSSQSTLPYQYLYITPLLCQIVSLSLHLTRRFLIVLPHLKCICIPCLLQMFYSFHLNPWCMAPCTLRMYYACIYACLLGYVHLYLYIHNVYNVCMHAYFHMYVCMYICTWVWIYISMSDVQKCISACLWHPDTCQYKCMHMYIYVCLCLHVCICIYFWCPYTHTAMFQMTRHLSWYMYIFIYACMPASLHVYK